MKQVQAITNSAEANTTPPDPVMDKRAFAKRWHGSTRWVDSLLAKGMPHLRIGERRVRIITAEADAWMVEKFGTRRIGPLNGDSSH